MLTVAEVGLELERLVVNRKLLGEREVRALEWESFKTSVTP